MDTGKVLFVGAGPGDPDLITVRGVKALQQADIVVYDRLAAPQLLKYAKPEAELVYCGKEPGLHTLAQDEITELIVREAEQGRVVARLKGGDPGIFGRVWEEAEACVERDVPFEVIPGITSGIAATAYAGIPLTHREYSSNVAFVSGHRRSGSGAAVTAASGVAASKSAISGGAAASGEAVAREVAPGVSTPEEATPGEAAPESAVSGKATAAGDTDWRAVAGCDTIVVYMGVGNLPEICANLRGPGGKAPETPAALVRWGTTSEQATLIGSLDTIAAQAKKAGFGSPAIFVVGEAVKLREKLGWYERQPLFGRKVLILGSREAVEAQADRWSALGAETAEIAVHVGDPTASAGAAIAATASVAAVAPATSASVTAVAPAAVATTVANLHGTIERSFAVTGVVAHAEGYVDELLLRGGFDTLFICDLPGLDALRRIAKERPDHTKQLRAIPELLGSDAFIEAEAQALLSKPPVRVAASS